MKLVQFDYEKSPTDITKRVGFIVAKPTQNYTVLEIVDDCGFEPVEMELELKAEYDRHVEALKLIQENYALKYKNFTASKVKNLEEL